MDSFNSPHGTIEPSPATHWTTYKDYLVTYPKVQSWRLTLHQLRTELPPTEFIVIGKEAYKNPQKGIKKHLHVFIRFLSPEYVDYGGPIATAAGIRGNVKIVTKTPEIVLCYVTKDNKVLGHHLYGEEEWKHLRRMIAHWRQQYQCKSKGVPCPVTAEAYSSPEDRLPESPLAPKLAPRKDARLQKQSRIRLAKGGFFNPRN